MVSTFQQQSGAVPQFISDCVVGEGPRGVSARGLCETLSVVACAPDPAAGGLYVCVCVYGIILVVLGKKTFDCAALLHIRLPPGGGSIAI